MINMRELLEDMVSRGASDLHITAGLPPQFRVDGAIQASNFPVLTPEATPPARLQRPDRRAAEALRERQGAGLLVRRAGPQPLPRERLPAARRAPRWRSARSRTDPRISRSSGCRRSCACSSSRPQGLILVTGPTGSGKSTTLATMVDHINREHGRAHHHDRGSDRVRPPAQEVHRQPARGQHRHRLVPAGAQVRAAPGSRRDPDRRDARPARPSRPR